MPAVTGAVRQATEADAEAIVALAVEAFGDSDGPAVRTYQRFAGGVGMWAVVDEGDRVVSASARIPHTFRLDGVELPGSQIEHVATAAGHRRQGLVRAQFEHHHARATADGELIQFIGGIPYLYRRFGYGYGLDHPLLFLPDETLLARQMASSGSPPLVRDATPDDLDALLALESRRPEAGIRTVRDRARWQLHFDLAASGPFERLLVTERSGRVTGWARLHHRPEERQLHLLPSVCAEPGALTALVHAALDLAEDSVGPPQRLPRRGPQRRAGDLPLHLGGAHRLREGRGGRRRPGARGGGPHRRAGRWHRARLVPGAGARALGGHEPGGAGERRVARTAPGAHGGLLPPPAR